MRFTSHPRQVEDRASRSRPSRRQTLGLFAIFLSTAALLAPRFAQAQDDADGAAVVGLFAPRAPFAGSLARKQYAEALAAALSAAAGQPFRGRAFASAAEFDAQVASGRLAFAVVEAQAAGNHTPIAQARSGGKASKAMVLAVGPGVSAEGLSGLAGRSLAPVPVGPGDEGFVFNHLLQGEVGGDFFGAGRGALDAQGALALVQKGRADAAFVWQGAAGGLRTVFTSRPVPLPVLVEVGAVSPAVRAAVQGAVGGLPGAGGVFDGFGAVDAAGLSALKRNLGAPQLRRTAPVLASMATELPPVTPHPAAANPAAAPLPDPAPALGLPVPPPDLF